MNHPSSRRTASRTSLRLDHAILATALACGLFAGSTQAQVIVSDPILEGSGAAIDASTAASYARQALQLEQEVQSAANTYAQLQNILMQAQNLGTNISLVSTPLTQISDSSQIVASACPGAGGGIVGDVLTALSSALSANEPVTTRQQMICAQIVTYQVDEYNKTVVALNAVGQFSSTTLTKINNLITSVDTLGKTSNAQAQAQSIQLNLEAAMKTWETQVQSDEYMIKALQHQQGVLAKVAMNGSNTILGNVIQASALKLAFTVNQ